MVSPMTGSASGIAVNEEVLRIIFSSYDNDYNYTMVFNIHRPSSNIVEDKSYTAQLYNS